MSHDPSLTEIQKEWHGTLRSYVIGFLASLLLTAVAFILVAARALAGRPLMFTIAALGMAQALIQLIFFLHVGQESKPRWEMVVFLFMVLVLFIIVTGSLWIMFDLDNRMMGSMVHD